MRRIFLDIPNVAFHKIIRQYAFETGQPSMTLQQQDTALIRYITLAHFRN